MAPAFYLLPPAILAVLLASLFFDAGQGVVRHIALLAVAVADAILHLAIGLRAVGLVCAVVFLAGEVTVGLGGDAHQGVVRLVAVPATARALAVDHGALGVGAIHLLALSRATVGSGHGAAAKAEAQLLLGDALDTCADLAGGAKGPAGQFGLVDKVPAVAVGGEQDAVFRRHGVKDIVVPFPGPVHRAGLGDVDQVLGFGKRLVPVFIFLGLACAANRQEGRHKQSEAEEDAPECCDVARRRPPSTARAT